MKIFLKRLITLVAALGLLSTTFLGVANAAMVGTGAAVAMDERAEHVAEIKDWLTQEDVRNKLIELGVDPASAGERVAAMTAQELQTLHDQINELPAGGIAEVVGIVFIVFILLELLGVTNVFTKF